MKTTTTNFNTKSRVGGAFKPVYLNGRATTMLTDAFRPAAPVVDLAPRAFTADLETFGYRAGEGTPFAAMYMARRNMKVAGLVAA